MLHSPSEQRATFRAELRTTVAVFAAAAVAVAVGIATVCTFAVGADRRAFVVAALVLLDCAVFVALVARLLGRTLLDPLVALAADAGAIARGDVARKPALRDAPGELSTIAGALTQLGRNLESERVERKRAERFAAIGRLATRIAHEVGNPLGAINLYAHLLRTSAVVDGDARDAITGIERESSRIDRIVRGLIEYARPRSSTPSVADVNAAARGAIAILMAQGRFARAQLSSELDHGEPMVAGQQSQFEQALLNLLSNAIAANRDGGRITLRTDRVTRASLEDGEVRRAGDPPLTIHPRTPPPVVAEWLARVRPPAEIVRILVADSGSGVAPEDRVRIFEPFYSTKPAGEGTGLGLAVVSNVVENMRGVVWVNDAREGGAAFHILLPALTGPRNAAEGEGMMLDKRKG